MIAQNSSGESRSSALLNIDQVSTLIQSNYYREKNAHHLPQFPLQHVYYKI